MKTIKELYDLKPVLKICIECGQNYPSENSEKLVENLLKEVKKHIIKRVK